MNVIVEYDSEARATYLPLHDTDEVSDTVSVSDLVMVDVADDGQVQGVEFLKPPPQISERDLQLVFQTYPEITAVVVKALADVGVHAA
jgi:uncharacterized protein YuzE